MDEYGRDSMTTEYDGISVDDILAEYQEEERAAVSQARYQAYLDDTPEESEDAPAPQESVDEEGVKLYRPRSAVATAKEEAREYVSRRIRENFAPESEAQPNEGPDPSGYDFPQEQPGGYDAYDDALRFSGWDPAEAGEYQAEAAQQAGSYGYDGEPDHSSVPGYDESPAEEPDYTIDERFNLGGRRANVYYGGEELDLGPDLDYEPTEQSTQAPSHWAEGEKGCQYEAEGGYPAEAEPDLPPKKSGKRRRKNGRKKKKQPLNAPPPSYIEDEDDYAAEFRDYSASPSDYAASGDYGYEQEDDNFSRGEENGSFPSFGQYLAGLVTGVLFRMRGSTSHPVTATMEDDEEDLGTELKPAAASKYYGSFVHSLRLRFRIGLVLLLIMSYIAVGLPLPGMLKTIQVQAAMCLTLQLTIMLLSLDLVTGSAINMARGRFGADSMAVLACVLTSIDALSVALDGFGSIHMPLCVLSSLSLMGALLSSLLSARGLRKALRVPAIGKRAYAVTGESGVRSGETTLLKSVRSSAGFVRRSEEAAPDETLFARFSPLLLAVTLLLALIVCLVKKSWGEFLYVFTALLSPAVPVTALLCFALPFCIGSVRIFSSGAAIAGWSGLCDIGQSKNLIVTDRDLFPDGSVELENIRIFADAPAEKIISYAGTMITASGSSISSCFGELMEKNGGSMRHVENFEYLSGGGMKGIIDGETVLCGSTDLMRLMNVRVPFRLVDKTTVLLAVDGILYGIFNMKYTAQPQVRKALVSLMRSNRHPVFAIRDFNVTPEMLHQSFDVATDGYDFPPYVERYAISEAKPAEDSKIAAVICREGLGPLTHMADTGRSMYVATRINLLLSLLSAVLGLLAVFIKFLTIGSVGTGFLLVFMLLWALPVAAVSVFLKF